MRDWEMESERKGEVEILYVSFMVRLSKGKDMVQFVCLVYGLI